MKLKMTISICLIFFFAINGNSGALQVSSKIAKPQAFMEKYLSNRWSLNTHSSKSKKEYDVYTMLPESYFDDIKYNVEYIPAYLRDKMQIVVKDGKLCNIFDKPITATNMCYVMDTYGRIYAYENDDPSIYPLNRYLYHSSFLRGAEVACAGQMTIIDGLLVMIDNNSGHYHPPLYGLIQVIDELVKRKSLFNKTLVCAVYGLSKFEITTHSNMKDMIVEEIKWRIKIKRSA